MNPSSHEIDFAKHIKILSKHSKPEREKPIKLLIEISSNLLQNPNNEKYRNLNWHRVRKRLMQCKICIDILKVAGFYESDDGKRLLFNTDEFDKLRTMHNVLLQFVSEECKYDDQEIKMQFSSKWKCQICTFVNKSQNSLCEICGHWSCSNCKYLNAELHLHCVKCDYSRLQASDGTQTLFPAINPNCTNYHEIKQHNVDTELLSVIPNQHDGYGVLCEKSHPLVYRGANTKKHAEYKNGFTCKICAKFFKYAYSYHCKDCLYDACHSCYQGTSNHELSKRSLQLVTDVTRNVIDQNNINSSYFNSNNQSMESHQPKQYKPGTPQQKLFNELVAFATIDSIESVKQIDFSSIFARFGGLDRDKSNQKDSKKNKSNYSESVFLNSRNEHISAFDCAQTVDNCPMVDIVGNTLRRYALYIQFMQKGDEKVDMIDTVYSDGYNNTDLLNDFNHLLLHHGNEFEDIYDVLRVKISDGKSCNLSNCLAFRRNQRDRFNCKNSNAVNQLYFGKENIVKQQLLDRAHCYFLHSSDIGHRLTKADKQSLLNEEVKINDTGNNDSTSITQKINKLINSNSNKNIPSKRRPFITECIEYSYGFAYLYWDYYQNEEKMINDIQYEPDITKFNVYKCFVNKKYSNIKSEALSNSIYNLSANQWKQLMEKATAHKNCSKALRIKCVSEHSHCYDMKLFDPITIDHFSALIMYCNFDELQRKFSETYRKQHENETYGEVKERHRNFYFVGRLLRECVDCFGMQYVVKQSPWVKSQSFMPDTVKDSLIVYHGIDRNCTFPSLYAYVKGPFSTTTDYCVAVSFSANKGVILQLDMPISDWSILAMQVTNLIFLRCFDCQWVSDFPNEKEVFCIGGERPFQFESIITTLTGTNYGKYIKAMKEMTFNMYNDDSFIGTWSTNDYSPKEFDQQMVYRLLSHELHRYFPNHKDAHPFNSCPEYIQHLLHSHCLSVKRIGFSVKKCKIQDSIFKQDNGWIKLNALLTIFPNVVSIKLVLYIGNMTNHVLYLKQTSIFESILSFIEFIQNNSKYTKLYSLAILMPILRNEDEMLDLVEKYKSAFLKYSWIIQIIITGRNRTKNANHLKDVISFRKIDKQNEVNYGYDALVRCDSGTL